MSRSLELTSNPPAVPVCIVRVCSFQCCPGCRSLDVPLLHSFRMKCSVMFQASLFCLLNGVCSPPGYPAQNPSLYVFFLQLTATLAYFPIPSVRCFPILIVGIKLKLSSLLSQLESSFQPPSLLYRKENQSTHQSLNQSVNQ